MAEFKRLRELSFDRKSKRTGNPEQLRVQLMQVDDGPKFAALTHFWRADSGEFCPPNRETLRITIKRAEAAEVIALLREVLDGGQGEPGAPAQASAPTLRGPRSESAPEGSQAPPASDPGWRRIDASKYAGRCCFCGEDYPEGEAVGYHPEGAPGRKAAHWPCVESARFGSDSAETEDAPDPTAGWDDAPSSKPPRDPEAEIALF